MVKLIISDFLNSLDANAPDKLDQVFSFVEQKGLGHKDYPDDGLLIIYNQYDKLSKTELEKECRSIIIDRNTLQVVNYTFDDPIYNKDATHILINVKDEDHSIWQCYEGTLLSVYNHNGKWYCSTRRLIPSDQSFWNRQKGDNRSHFALMEECLVNCGYKNFDEFTESLKDSYCYNFVLMHYENQNYVDYSHLWGANYKKIALVLIRNKSTQDEVNLSDNLEDYFNKSIFCENIFIPENYKDLSIIQQENNKKTIDIPAKNEGLIVKIYDKNTGKNNILKFQTIDYSFAKTTNNEKSVYRGFVKLYQLDELNSYLNNYKIFEKYKKIHDIKNNVDYDVIGVVDAVMKVCSYELFELFNYFWNIKTGKNKNTDKYDSLPKEYKVLLYVVRGIYFNKKAEYINNKKNNLNIRSELSINDIYDTLKKSTDVSCIINYLKSRQLFFKNHEILVPTLKKDKKMELTNLYVDLLVKELNEQSIY